MLLLITTRLQIKQINIHLGMQLLNNFLNTSDHFKFFSFLLHLTTSIFE